LKIFFILLFLYTTQILSQFRQTASVDIKIKLIKSISVFVNSESTSFNNSDEKLENSEMVTAENSEKRNLIINYNNRALYKGNVKNDEKLNISNKNVQNYFVKISNDNASNYFPISENSSENLCLSTSQKLQFKLDANSKSIYYTNDFSITIVY
jgi:hypothetical protein